MSDPIRDRRPTKADGDSKWGDVLVYRDGCWSSCFHGNVKQGEWWKPIDQTPPPEEKPKYKRHRFKNRIHAGVFGNEVESLEVLPGDPPDLDALLREVDKILAAPVKWATGTDALQAARHGEGDNK